MPALPIKPMFLLQLRNELWKLFGKKRTYIGSAMFLLAQAILILGLTYGGVLRAPSCASSSAMVSRWSII